MCMGGARGGDTEAEKERSRSIDRQIKEDEKRVKKEVKLLLLGEFLQVLLEYGKQEKGARGGRRTREGGSCPMDSSGGGGRGEQASQFSRLGMRKLRAVI